MNYEPTESQIDSLFAKIKQDAQANGYFLNPDEVFVKLLVKGLLVNENRFGYMACPCRLAYEDKELDNDIICPCDYRDQDIAEFGACYCGLYVSKKIASGQEKLGSIPDRRPPDKLAKAEIENHRQPAAINNLAYPVYRCKVCGYLCAREHPPEQCPICKVPKERFERFI